MKGYTGYTRVRVRVVQRVVPFNSPTYLPSYLLTTATGSIVLTTLLNAALALTLTLTHAGSIVLTTLLNAAFLSGPLTLAIVVGALVVVVAVFGYNDNGDR